VQGGSLGSQIMGLQKHYNNNKSVEGTQDNVKSETSGFDMQKNEQNKYFQNEKENKIESPEKSIESSIKPTKPKS